MPPRKKPTPSEPRILPPSPPLPTPSLDSTSLRMSYRIGRGEQGVLTFEPYKSLLLPLWRFKTPAIATASLAALLSAFHSYVARGDFVGADMARKFVQMGMTRAKRYANHKGGKKYDRSEREIEREGGGRRVLERSEGHEGRAEKEEASGVFRRGWEECRADERYGELRKAFQKEQEEWDRAGRSVKIEGGVKEEGDVQEEDDIEVKEEFDQE